MLLRELNRCKSAIGGVRKINTDVTCWQDPPEPKQSFEMPPVMSFIYSRNTLLLATENIRV